MFFVCFSLFLLYVIVFSSCFDGFSLCFQCFLSFSVLVVFVFCVCVFGCLFIDFHLFSGCFIVRRGGPKGPWGTLLVTTCWFHPPPVSIPWGPKGSRGPKLVVSLFPGGGSQGPLGNPTCHHLLVSPPSLSRSPGAPRVPGP